MSGFTSDNLKPLSIGLNLLALGSGVALASAVLLAGLVQFATRGLSYTLTALFFFSVMTMFAAPLACFFGPIGHRARVWLTASVLFPIAGLWLGGDASAGFALFGAASALKFLAALSRMLELPQATTRLHQVVGAALVAAALLGVSYWLTPYPRLWMPIFLLALVPLAAALVGMVTLLGMLAARTRQLQRELEPREEYLGLSRS